MGTVLNVDVKHAAVVVCSVERHAADRPWVLVPVAEDHVRGMLDYVFAVAETVEHPQCTGVRRGPVPLFARGFDLLYLRLRFDVEPVPVGRQGLQNKFRASLVIPSAIYRPKVRRSTLRGHIEMPAGCHR